MIIDFPRLKFVDENTLEDQLDHIATEMIEVDEAFDEAAFAGGDWNRVAEELCDGMQSHATALYMVEKLHGINPVLAMERVKAKNAARGYQL